VDGLRVFARAGDVVEEIESFDNRVRNSFPVPPASGSTPDDLRSAPTPSFLRFQGPSPHALLRGDASLWVEALSPQRTAGAVNEVEFSPDGKRLITRQGPSGRGRDKLKYPVNVTSCVWDIEGNEVRCNPWREMVDRPSPLDLSGDLGLLLSHGVPWKARSSASPGTWVFERQPPPAGSGVSCAAFSPDGALLVTGHADGSVSIGNLEPGRRPARLKSHAAAVVCVALDPGKGRVVSLAADQEMTELVATSIETGKALFRVEVTTRAERIGFSPHGRFIITTVKINEDHPAVEGARHPADKSFRPELISDGLGFGPAHPYILALHLHDAETGKEVRPFQYQGVCAFSPDETRLLTVDQTVIEVEGGHGWDGYFSRELRPGRVVSVRDTLSGKVLKQLAGHEDGVSAVAFSRDGKYILTGSWDNTARLWDAASGEQKVRYLGHTDYVGAVSMSPDGRWVCTGSWDGTTRLWDARTGEEKCRLVAFPDGTWAVTDPSGRYDGSNGGDGAGLHWVVGNEPIELAQFKDRYYDPGLLAKHLGLSTQPLRDVATLAAPRLHPAVALAPPTRDRLAVGVTLTDRGGGFGKLLVLINGKEAREVAPDAIPRGPDPKVRQLEVDLSGDPRVEAGKPNRVEVLAYNAEGYLRSRGSEVILLGPGPADARPPELWVVAAGVADYAGPSLTLRYAAKDARDFAKALELGGTRLFGPKKVRLSVFTTLPPTAADRPAPATAGRPTKAGLVKALETTQAARPEDILVVYLSGHGVSRREGDSEEYYFLTADAISANLNDTAVRDRDALSGAALRGLLASCPARHQVLVLDTCAAGRAVDRLSDRREVNAEQLRALERVKDRTGTFVLAGCAADAVSYEASRYAQGVLTHALLLGMRSELVPGGEVNVGELFKFAVDQVPQLAGGIGGVQRPQLGLPRVGSPFPVGLLTVEDRAKVPLERERPLVQRALFQDQDALDDVLGFGKRVDEAFRGTARRGQGGPPVVFVDAREVAGAGRVAGRYTVDGGRVTVRVKVYVGAKVATFEVAGEKAKLDELATQVAREAEKRLTQ
jgi:WD40 repeat protein